MDKPIFILKPSIFNALFPLFMLNLWRTARFAIPIYLAAAALSLIGWLDTAIPLITTWLVIVLLIGAAIPLIYRLIILMNSRYRFYHTHVVAEFKFFIIKSQSVAYDKVTNVSVDISLWDRICNAGDVTLHTADDDTADLTLQYVKDPQSVQDMIRHTVGRRAPQATPSPRSSRVSHQRAQ